MKEIIREKLLDQLGLWRNKQVIKVITGIRRCGKSTLMQQYRQYLLNQGVEESCIQYVNLEDLSNEHLLEYHALYDFLSQNLCPSETNYILLDEVQMVEEFQKAIDSLFLKPNVDICITGSNAYMLSGSIATLLSGRYVEIHVTPLSFSEYCQAFGLPAERQYARYIGESSFPYAAQLEAPDAVTSYLHNLYQTIVLKDIIARTRIKEPDVLDRLVRYLADNIGNITSINKICATLKSSGTSATNHTIDSYMDQLTQSYLFYKVSRYDVKGREYLRTGHKYYLSDVGMRNMLLGVKGGDLGHILENVVYLELVRRGGQVLIGKSGSQEIDFVSIRNGNPVYYQVALTVRDASTLSRELAPLQSLRDSYPKFLITMDPDPEVDHKGIKQLYALDWLLGT